MKRKALRLACLFLMQSTLRFLKGEELKQAREMIANAMETAQPVPERKGRSFLRSLLLKLAQWNLEATSRLLNGLIRMHVLR